VIGEFSVEAQTRWDAVSLLRLLGRHHAWTVQLGDSRWVVIGRADTDAAGREVEAIVARWAADRGRPSLADTLVNEVAVLGSAEPVQ
jgi:hypothetical protein